MAEFVYSEEKIIGIDEPITLENNTGASFDVSVGVGIIFRKSGLYRISVDGKHTSIEIEPERKKGKWIVTSEFEDCRYAKCNQCNVTQVFYYGKPLTNYCPDCGSYNGGEHSEID